MSQFGFDPSIILGATKVNEPTINDTLQTLASLSQSRTADQHNQAQLADMLRKRGQEQTLADITKANAGTGVGLVPDLMRAGLGQQAMAWQDQTAQMAAKKVEGEKAVREGRAADFKMMGDVFSGVNSQEDYDAALPRLPEHYRTLMPAQFDPAMTKRLAGLGLSAKDRSDLEQKGLDRTAAEKRAELDRTNRTTNARILAGQKGAEADLDNVTNLRKEITARPEIKKYRGASAELASLKELAKESTGANDMALVFAFMKAMDPESVVRESEYASAEAAGKPTDRMMGLVSRWYTGGRLSDGQKKAFIRAAAAAQSGHKTAYEKARKTYLGIAKKNKWDVADLGLDDDSSGAGKVSLEDDPAAWGDADEARLKELERKAGGAK